MRNKAAWCLLAVFLLSYLPSEAQSYSALNRYSHNQIKDNKIKLQLHKRIYLGVYGWHFMNNPMSMRVRDTIFATNDDMVNHIGGVEVDTSFSTNAKLSKSLSGYLGVSVPIAMASEKSMFCLDIEANVLMGNLTYDSIKIPLVYKDLYMAESIPFMMASGPISFNYKYGGDASLSREHKTLLSAGAGIATSYITIDDGTKSDALIKAVPFVKAEVGFVLGVAVKVRGTAYLGNYNLIDYKSKDLSFATGVISRTYGGPLGYNISVILMPLALTWDKPANR
ncbi:MAG: hypothetical protein H6550_10680 [Chitinophagales bacterium]|nr:hypothetical protein [Chitinophagales bacterium]